MEEGIQLVEHDQRAGERAQRRSALLALTATLLLLAVFGLFAAAGKPSQVVAEGLSTELFLMLSVATAVLAFMLGGLLVGLAYPGSRAAAAWLGLGMVLLAALTLGVGEIGPVLVPEAEQLRTVRGWGMLAVFVAFTFGLGAGSKPERAAFLPRFAAALAAVSIAVHQLGLDGIVVFELAWAIMVLAQGAAYLATRESMHIWVAISLVGFLLSEIGVADASANGWWIVGVPALRMLGLGSAVVGLLVDLRAASMARARWLRASRARVASLQDETTATRLALEERDHEARAALSAIEFTAHTIGAARDLDAAALHQLEHALATELELLRRLVTLPDADLPRRPYSVLDAISGVVALATSRGMDIELALDRRLMAFGSRQATAEICQTILENARRHAPGATVLIGAARLDDRVLLRFDDSGPGIPLDKRSQVFRRGGDGGHPSSAEGRGLGLYIAQRLAREQGGELWAADADAGGASFRLLLPAAPQAPSRSDQLPAESVSP